MQSLPDKNFYFSYSPMNTIEHLEQISFCKSCYYNPVAMILDFRVFVTLIGICLAFKVSTINNQPLKFKYKKSSSFINSTNIGHFIVYLQSLIASKYIFLLFGNLLYRKSFHEAFLINFSKTSYIVFLLVDLFLVLFFSFQRYEKKYSKSTLLVLLVYFLLLALSNFFNFDVYYLDFGFPEVTAGFITMSMMTSFYSKTIASFY